MQKVFATAVVSVVAAGHVMLHKSIYTALYYTRFKSTTTLDKEFDDAPPPRDGTLLFPSLLNYRRLLLLYIPRAVRIITLAI